MKIYLWTAQILVILAGMLSVGTANALGNLAVTNVVAEHREFTTMVDITYDLETVDSLPVTVGMYLSTDGGISFPFQCQSVSGAVGSDVSPGLGLIIEWDAGVDFPGFNTANCRFRVTADDGGVVVPAGFVMIPPVEVSMPVTFTMGSPVVNNGTPHDVVLTSRFNMAATVVTNAQYLSSLQWALIEGHVTLTDTTVVDNLDGSTEVLFSLEHQISYNSGIFSTSAPDRPVAGISWYGSVAYCDWLSLQDGLPRAYDHGTWSCNGGDPYTALGFRLPAEAEWELACRAGTTTHFSTGDCLDAGTEANYNGGSPYFGCPSGPYLGHVSDVGSYPANQWGLFDVHGNLWEWCNDWYGAYIGDETDPLGVEVGDYRVKRGGSWWPSAEYSRSAHRSASFPINLYSDVGFRPVKSIQ